MLVPSSLPSCGHLSIFHYDVHSNWGILVVVIIIVVVIIVIIVRSFDCCFGGARLPILAGILQIPVFSVPVALFSQESRFLFRRNFFGTPLGILSVWGLCRKLRRI
jgi:hypothetical protein